MEPEVSIIITNHDYGRFVGQAVDSALAQRGPAVEVIVVDDASTDDSRAIIGGFGDAVRPVLLPENRGQAAAMNAGFRISRGRLIMFLDADDTLEPYAAEALAAVARPGASRIHGFVELVDGAEGSRGRLPAGRLPAGDVARLVLRDGGYAATGTTGAAYVRPAIEPLMPIPEDEWRVAPDSYLKLLSSFVGDCAAVDRVLGRVRIHGRNKWSMDRVEPDRLLEYLEVDALKHALLDRMAPRLGTRVPRDWLLRSVPHVQSRIALLRLAPDRHPYRSDTRRGLAWRGAAAAFTSDGAALRKRLLLAAWFVAVAALPRRPAARCIDAAFLRTHRTRRLLRMPRWGGRRDDRAA